MPALPPGRPIRARLLCARGSLHPRCPHSSILFTSTALFRQRAPAPWFLWAGSKTSPANPPANSRAGHRIPAPRSVRCARPSTPPSPSASRRGASSMALRRIADMNLIVPAAGSAPTAPAAKVCRGELAPGRRRPPRAPRVRCAGFAAVAGHRRRRYARRPLCGQRRVPPAYSQCELRHSDPITSAAFVQYRGRGFEFVDRIAVGTAHRRIPAAGMRCSPFSGSSIAKAAASSRSGPLSSVAEQATASLPFRPAVHGRTGGELEPSHRPRTHRASARPFARCSHRCNDGEQVVCFQLFAQSVTLI